MNRIFYTWHCHLCRAKTKLVSILQIFFISKLLTTKQFTKSLWISSQSHFNFFILHGLLTFASNNPEIVHNRYFKFILIFWNVTVNSFFSFYLFYFYFIIVDYNIFGLRKNREFMGQTWSTEGVHVLYFPDFTAGNPKVIWVFITSTSEVPGELSHINMISSHEKTGLLFNTWIYM